MRIAPVLVVTLVVSLFAGCVGPSNPYDPDTDPARQARARLWGRVVLVDAELDEAALEAEARLLELRLVDEEGAEVAKLAGGDLDVEGGVASFLFVDVVPGAYDVEVGALDERFLGPGPGRVTLAPAEVRALPDTRFVAPPRTPSSDEPGGVIAGGVRALGGAVGPRTVELFRLDAEGAASLRTMTTDTTGAFRFDGLDDGTYAVVASADGYTPAYAMDLALAREGDADPELLLDDDEALTLQPVTAVLGFPDEVTLAGGVRYTRDDAVTLNVLAFGGANPVSAMRVGTDASFLDDEGAEVPFASYAASVEVALPDEEGPIALFAQFEARSAEGFAFVTPIFSATVVRDVSPPEILGVEVDGATMGADGTRYLTADAVAPAIRVDANDSYGAVDGIVVEESEAEPTFALEAFSALFAPGGRTYVTEALALSSGDGVKPLWVALKDRAGNTSAPLPVVVVVDTIGPVIDLVSIAGGADYVLSAVVSVEVESASADIAEIALARGGSEPTDFQSFVTGQPLPFLLDAGDGSRSVLVRLRDFAGNESADIGDSVVVDAGAAVLAPALWDDREVPVEIVARASAEARVVLGDVADDALTLLAGADYLATPPATLSAPDDGSYRVFAQVRDAAGTESGVLVADVVVDTAGPEFGAGGVQIDRGAAATRFVSVSISVDAAVPDDVEDMAVATDGVVDTESFQPYAPAVTAVLPPGDCDGDGDPATADECKSVCVVLRDAAGNVSGSSCDAIRLDTTPPSTPTITPLFGRVRADTVEIRVVEPATDFDGEPVESYEMTSVAGDFFEVTGTGPFRFRLRKNRDNELCVRGKDAAGNVGIEDCALISEETLRFVIANGIDAHAADLFGDYLAFAGRGGMYLHDLRGAPPESTDDAEHVMMLTAGLAGSDFAGGSGGDFVRLGGDLGNLVLTYGPTYGNDQRFNVVVKQLVAGDLSAGVVREGQLEGNSFDTDGRYVAYAATDGVYVHDLGPALANLSTAAMTPRSSDLLVSQPSPALCPGTGPRVTRGVVVWCELVGAVPSVMRSRITDLVDPNDPVDDQRVVEKVSGADPVASAVGTIFDDPTIIQPLISERFIVWLEARASGNALVFLEGGIDAPLAQASTTVFSQPMQARNCAPLNVDRLSDMSGGRIGFLTIADTSLGLTDVALFDLDLPGAKASCVTDDLAPQDAPSLDGPRLVFRDTANNEALALVEIPRTRWLSSTPELAFEPVTSGRGGAVAWVETRPVVCDDDGDCEQGERCGGGSCTGEQRVISLLARDLTLIDPGDEVLLDQSVVFFGPAESDPPYAVGGELVAWARGPSMFAPPPYEILASSLSGTPLSVASNATRALAVDPEGERIAWVQHAGGPAGEGQLMLSTLSGSVVSTVTIASLVTAVPHVDVERLANGTPVVVWQRGGDIDDRRSGGELVVSVAQSAGVEVPVFDRGGATVVATSESARVRGPKVARVANDFFVAYLLAAAGFDLLEPHACRLDVANARCIDDERLAFAQAEVRDISISRDGLVAFRSDEESIDEVVVFDVRARRRVWATPVRPADSDRSSPDIAEGHLVWSDASLGTPDIFEMVLRP